MILTVKTSDRYKSQYWNRFEQKRNRYFSTIRKLTLKALTEQLQPAITAIESGAQDPETRISFQPIANLFQSIYPLVGTEFAVDSFRSVEGQKSLYTEIQTKDRADDRLSFFQRFLRSYALTQCGDKITGITETTRNFVRSVMAEATTQGLSVAQTVKKLREKWQQIGKHRATMISRTEIISASNVASLEGAKATGIALNKVWLATSDGRTRSKHSAVDGQKRDINEPFNVGGDKLKHPGDTTLGASRDNTIQCRCTLYYEPKR